VKDVPFVKIKNLLKGKDEILLVVRGILNNFGLNWTGGPLVAVLVMGEMITLSHIRSHRCAFFPSSTKEKAYYSLLQCLSVLSATGSDIALNKKRH